MEIDDSIYISDTESDSSDEPTKPTIGIRKHFHQSSRGWKYKIRMQINKEIRSFEKFLNKRGLEIDELIIKKKTENKKKLELSKRISIIEEKRHTEPLNAMKVFQEKDKINLADSKYDQFRIGLNLNDLLPSLRSVKNCRKEMDNQFKIVETKLGCYVDIKQKLQTVLKPIIKRMNIQSDQIIKIKLSGDGVNMDRKIKLFAFSFSIINDHSNCNGSNGSYIIGLFKIDTENYEHVNECLMKPFEEICNLENILEVEGVLFKLTFQMGGDMKFLAIYGGINAANSTHPCVWCTASKHDFCKLELDTNAKARSIKESLLLLNEKKDNLGYKNKPMCLLFEFTEIIPDLLHLFLRISDKLEDTLLKNLREQKNTNEILKNNTNYIKFASFIDYLGIKNFLSFKDNHSFDKRQLTGKEKKIFFENITTDLFLEIISDPEKALQMYRLWFDFYHIYLCIQSNELTSHEIKDRTKNWLELFLTVYKKSDITPYIHAFAHHLYEFREREINLNLYSQEGAEAQNSFSIRQFYSSTNRKNSNKVGKENKEFLVQLLRKKCRQEIYFNL
jgi:hypothetical protein